MPDWENIVANRLANLILEVPEKNEVLAELAAHLEETYASLRAEGLSQEEALHRTLSQVRNWDELRRKIQTAKKKEGKMAKRGPLNWLPVGTTFVLSMSPLMGALRAGMFPHGFLVNSNASLLIYVPWLLALPVAGAIGAFWSRRAGSGRGARLAVCLVPIIALTGLFLLCLPVNLPLVPGEAGRQLSYLASCFLGWVVIPSVALLAGALPLLADYSWGRKTSSFSAGI
jgi:hypothetical protein